MATNFLQSRIDQVLQKMNTDNGCTIPEALEKAIYEAAKNYLPLEDDYKDFNWLLEALANAHQYIKTSKRFKELRALTNWPEIKEIEPEPEEGYSLMKVLEKAKKFEDKEDCLSFIKYLFEEKGYSFIVRDQDELVTVLELGDGDTKTKINSIEYEDGYILISYGGGHYEEEVVLEYILSPGGKLLMAETAEFYNMVMEALKP